MSTSGIKKHSHLARATVVIALFSLLSRVAGLVRDRVFAGTFGAGDTLDVYYAAFRVPDFLFNLLILGTFSAAFIPVFTEYLVRDKKSAHRLAISFLNLTLIVMGALSALLMILAPQLVSAIVPGFSEAKQLQTVSLTRVMMLSPLFFSLSSVFSSILNSYKRFTLVAALPLVYNFSIIFGVMVFYPIFGLMGLSFGVVIGAFLHMSLQIPSAWRLGFRWRPILDLGSAGARSVVKLFLPRIFGMDQSQVSLLISAVIGSTLAAGSITIYSLANNLQSVILGVFAVSFATVAFPILSEAAARGDRATFREVFNINMSQILYAVVPLSALMLILRAQIVRLILGTGAFSWEDTILTIATLGFFIMSLFVQSLIPLFARAFYSLKNTVYPVIAGLAGIAVNIGAAWTLTHRYDYGVAGLAMAFSIASFVNFLLLFVGLEIKFGNLVDIELAIKLQRIVVATLAMGTGSYITLYMVAPWVNTHTVLGLLAQAVAAGIVGIALYLGSSFLLGVPESKHLVATGKLWLRKTREAFIRIPQ